jgi:hypothetical protein
VLLISLTEDKAKLAEYLKDIFNHLIGNDEFPSMLKLVKDVLPKKSASVYNTLGNTLLKLYDQKIEFHQFKVEISKELALKETDDLHFIRQIFIVAEENSRQSDFNLVDARNGLEMIRERQRQLKDLEESERKKLLSSIPDDEKL